MTLVTSVTSGAPVMLVWLVTLLTLVTLLALKLIFPGCQPYFSYGDLYSSGLKIHAIQPDMLKCKI